jgi:hypothetical protein
MNSDLVDPRPGLEEEFAAARKQLQREMGGHPRRRPPRAPSALREDPGPPARRMAGDGRGSATTDSRPIYIDATLDPMLTRLEIDDELLRALMARHPGASRREAVERAIRSHLSKDASAAVRALRGSLSIEDVSGQVRRENRRV